MTVSRIQLTGRGPEFSRLVAGVWRLGEWGMDTRGLLGFIHGCLDLGITTFDNADKVSRPWSLRGFLRLTRW